MADAIDKVSSLINKYKNWRVSGFPDINSARVNCRSELARLRMELIEQKKQIEKQPDTGGGITIVEGKYVYNEELLKKSREDYKRKQELLAEYSAAISMINKFNPSKEIK